MFSLHPKCAMLLFAEKKNRFLLPDQAKEGKSK
jgi:hypothetical protein